MGMILAPIGILVGSGGASTGLAFTVGFGFVVWIVVAYAITKPIELAIKNKDKIKDVIKNNTVNLNQQSANNTITQKQKNTQIDTNLNIRNNNITSLEEEEIYTQVSREFSDNRKEGMWTKALIQSEGDENKAKISYLKFRVDILKQELIDKKNNDLIQKQYEENIKFIDLEKDIVDQISIIVKKNDYDFEAEKISFRGSNLVTWVTLSTNYKNSLISNLIDNEIIAIKIFKEKKRSFFWINNNGEKVFFDSVELVEKNILEYYHDLIEKIRLLKEHNKLK